MVRGYFSCEIAALDILDSVLESATSQPPEAVSGGDGTAHGQGSLQREASVQLEHPKWPSGASRGVTKVSYTHDSLIDLLIAHPTWTQNEFAAHFGYTPGWLSQIINSDAFKAQYAARRKELVDPLLLQTIEANFDGLISRSQALLIEKLNRPSSAISDGLVLKTLELASRARGYGARVEQPTAQVNVNLHLEDLAGNLTSLLTRKKSESGQTFDAETPA